ncbi:MAG: serine/threonine-protein kinase [Planctomycetota bacterium]
MSECVTPADLEDLHSGRLSHEKSAAVRTHVEQCPDCSQAERDMLQANEALLVRARKCRASRHGTTMSLESLLREVDPQETDTPADALAHDADMALSLAARLDAIASRYQPREPSHRSADVQVDDVPRSGRYRAEQLLGQGGMGRVVKARDELLERDVAIKTIRPDLAADVSLNEAKAVANLQHPHIVPIYDVVREDGVDFIVMEYVPGGDLHEMIRKRGNIPVARAVNIAMDLCDALAFAHENGIIHRDIKPGNVLMGRSATAKIADFGLAVNDAEGMTIGEIAGTLAYMAPEILKRKQNVDECSEVYALGVTLYQMLAGDPPHHQVTDQLDGCLRQVIEKATASDRSQRFATFRKFRAALQEANKQLRKNVSKILCHECGDILTQADHCLACKTPADLLKIKCPECSENQGIDSDACLHCGAEIGAVSARAKTMLKAYRDASKQEWRNALQQLTMLDGEAELVGSAKTLMDKLKSKQQQADEMEQRARKLQQAGNLHDALYQWENLCRVDSIHEEGRRQVANLLQKLEGRLLDDLNQKAIACLDAGDLKKTDQIITKLNNNPLGKRYTAKLATMLAEARKRRANKLCREGAGYFRRGEYFAARQTLDTALEYATDEEMRRPIRFAIKLTEQHERLKRAQDHLKTKNETMARTELEKLDASELTGNTLSEFRNCQSRLDAITKLRRLKKLLLVCGLALTATVAFSLLYPAVSERAASYFNRSREKERDAIVANINDKLADVEETTDVNQWADLLTRAMMLTVKLGSPQQVAVQNETSDTEDPFKKLGTVKFGDGLWNVLITCLNKAYEDESIEMKAETVRDFRRLIYDELRPQEESRMQWERLGPCELLACDQPTGWLSDACELAQQDPPPTSVLRASLIGSDQAAAALRALSEYLGNYPDGSAAVDHDTCTELQQRKEILNTVLTLSRRGGCPALTVREHVGQILAQSTFAQDNARARILEAHDKELRAREAQGTDFATLRNRWMEMWANRQQCSHCTKDRSNELRDFARLGEQLRLCAALEKLLLDSPTGQDARTGQTYLEQIKATDYHTRNPTGVEKLERQLQQ